MSLWQKGENVLHYIAKQTILSHQATSTLPLNNDFLDKCENFPIPLGLNEDKV